MFGSNNNKRQDKHINNRIKNILNFIDIEVDGFDIKTGFIQPKSVRHLYS